MIGSSGFCSKPPITEPLAVGSCRGLFIRGSYGTLVGAPVCGKGSTSQPCATATAASLRSEMQRDAGGCRRMPERAGGCNGMQMQQPAYAQAAAPLRPVSEGRGRCCRRRPKACGARCQGREQAIQTIAWERPTRTRGQAAGPGGAPPARSVSCRSDSAGNEPGNRLRVLVCTAGGCFRARTRQPARVTRTGYRAVSITNRTKCKEVCYTYSVNLL